MSAEIISEIAPWLIGSSVAVIIWLVRLEAKVLSLEKEADNNSKKDDKIWEKFNHIESKLGDIYTILARLETLIEVNKNAVPK